jgi:hypothetical protein
MVGGWGLGYKYKGLKVGRKLLEEFSLKCFATFSFKAMVLVFYLEPNLLKKKG